jgi:hypothetical protein
VRYLKSGFWPARRFQSPGELDRQYADCRDVCNRRRHASGRFPVDERLEEERRALRPLPPERFEWSGARSVRVPLDGYLRHGGCFYRAPLSLVQQRVGEGSGGGPRPLSGSAKACGASPARRAEGLLSASGGWWPSDAELRGGVADRNDVAVRVWCRGQQGSRRAGAGS